jgi:hypothetical protein
MTKETPRRCCRTPSLKAANLTRHTTQAYSHYTWVKSGKRLLVCDIQVSACVIWILSARTPQHTHTHTHTRTHAHTHTRTHTHTHTHTQLKTNKHTPMVPVYRPTLEHNACDSPIAAASRDSICAADTAAADPIKQVKQADT